MRKLWQTKWFGIQFNDFIDVDSVNIADEKFYEKFYEKFKVPDRGSVNPTPLGG